jgi:hypothetical protein
MDHLSEAFARLSVLRSSSAVSVYQGGDGGVYCGAPIAAGTVLGRIRGRPAYIWELEHERYMIVDRDDGAGGLGDLGARGERDMERDELRDRYGRRWRDVLFTCEGRRAGAY